MSESSPIRCVLLTGNKLRHRYVAEVVSRRLQLVGVVCEAKSAASGPTVAASMAPADSSDVSRHFAEMDAAERHYFGEVAHFPVPNDCCLVLDHGKVNDPEVFSWIQALRPDGLLLYGTSIVKEPLLSAYHDRVVNMHLGLSPYYRGTATNFWPLVNNEPECVGVTIHLAVRAVDAGPILKQARPEPEISDRPHDLGCKTIMRGAEILAEGAVKWLNKEIKAVPQQTNTGRLYRRKDFNPEALRRMWSNFEGGMMSSYLACLPERRARFPITE